MTTCTGLVSSSVPNSLLPIVMLSPVVIPPSPALGVIVLGAVCVLRPDPAPHRHHLDAQYMGRPLRQRLLRTKGLSLGFDRGIDLPLHWQALPACSHFRLITMLLPCLGLCGYLHFSFPSSECNIVLLPVLFNMGSP